MSSIRKFYEEKVVLHDEHGRPVNMWYNEDIRPMPPHRRTWTGTTYFMYQSSVGIIIVTWSVGASLLGFGLNAWQAILNVMLGYILVGCLTMLGSQIGGKWHIGFPAANRYSWGMRGNWFPVLNRVVLMTVWFATESWLGSMCMKATIGALWPSFYTMKNTLPDSVPMETNDFVAWLIFTFLCYLLVFLKPELFHWPAVVAGSFSFVNSLALMAWFVHAAGGPGILFHSTESLVGVTPAGGSQFAWMFVRGITTVISSQSTGILGMADWGRFAKTPGCQRYPQGAGMALSDMYSAIIGIICASCSATIYPEVGLVWNPALLLTQIQLHEAPAARAAVFFSSLPILASQLFVTVSASCCGGGLDMAGLLPKFINLRRGGWVVCIVGCLIQPWQLANTNNKFIAVMGAYAIFLAPLTGILHCEFYLVRKQRISLTDLYTPNSSSSYWYFHGVNWRTLVSFFIGISFFFPGFIHSVTPSIEVSIGWTHLFYMCYPLGYFGTMLIHYTINHFFPVPDLYKIDEYDKFGTFAPGEKTPFGVIVGLPTHNEENRTSSILQVGDDSDGKKAKATSSSVST